MIEIVAVVLIALFFVGMGFGLGRQSVPDVEPVEAKFNCPYCSIEITGHKNLDLINHVTCIGKSTEDLALEAAKPKNKPAEFYARYFVDRKQPGQDHTPFTYNTSTGQWTRVKVDIYRNGEVAETIYAQTQESAKNSADKAIDFWKYKERVNG